MSENRYIISIDQSTSATKGILFDLSGKEILKTSLPHKQYYPKPSWVEQDPEEIFNNIINIVHFLITESHINPEDLSGLTLTNQRETVVIWDKRNGRPLYNAIVWQCMRGTEICETLKEKGFERNIREKTGLLLDPYFSASKIKWAFDNIDLPVNNTLVGTMDSFIIWKLTGGEVHASDYSNASRTLLFNIKELKWDEEILDIFGIPINSLPKVLPSNIVWGYTDCGGLLKKKIPISGILGDSQAALFGLGCFEKGMTKVTYGTGSSIAMNIGDKFLAPPKGIVTSIGWGTNKETIYIFEGNVHSTGATVKWLIDNLGIIKDADEAEKLCSLIDDNEGVYFVPAFSGLGAPYWDNKAKGTILGLTFKSRKEHIVRAGIESIAYQIRDVLDVFMEHSKTEIKEIRADGGATKNKFLMQFQSDITGINILCSSFEDMSAFGSFLMGGLGFGVWKDYDEISLLVNEKLSLTYAPKMSLDERERKYKEWKEAVKRIIND
ncbi:MAG TPA: glycerol kinase GlpK [Dictyoglomaceae bacterium]|nr:glycerol kinase GlpK [Dictyoglomaceae bacterium]HPU43780.1 glycerol kinase GlpK [Dictyoglomaceae bacterium]